MKNPSENTVEIVIVMDMSHPIDWNSLSGVMCAHTNECTSCRQGQVEPCRACDMNYGLCLCAKEEEPGAEGSDGAAQYCASHFGQRVLNLWCGCKLALGFLRSRESG